MQKRSLLGGQELEILKVVWQRESATVRDVYAALNEQRKVAYTTVMTMMTILERKGYLKRTLVDRAYIYRAAKPQKQVMRGMVRDFLDRVFNGAAEPLLVHLVEDQRLTEADLNEVRKMIRGKVS